jgi:chromosome segregation ATPase
MTLFDGGNAMSDLPELNYNWGRMLDAVGNVVAFVLTPKDVRELIAERDQLRAEVNRLEAEVAELKRSLDVAKQAVIDKAAITAERDQYLRSLYAFYALMEPQDQFEPEQLAEIERNPETLADVIAEIENDLRSRGMLDAG